MTGWPRPSLSHLASLTDGIGVVEHARLRHPRRDLGYCTDDAGRALAVSSSLPGDTDAHRIAATSLAFLQRAHQGGGAFALRTDAAGRVTGDPPSDDASGRALLGLGVAAARAPWPAVAADALLLFEAAAGFRSPHPRAIGSAVLGAAEVLAAFPRHGTAASLLADALEILPGPGPDGGWRWPEERLTYANALLPHARLAAALALGRRDEAGTSLALLEWLVDEETLGDHFSFTPVGGRGRDDPVPGFDQQPIEAWAMAEACSCALDCTGSPRWADEVLRAGRWFLGDNDRGAAMCDPATGGSYDGLAADGVNRNQGAESTLACIATMRLARTAAAQGGSGPLPGRRQRSHAARLRSLVGSGADGSR